MNNPKLLSLSLVLLLAACGGGGGGDGDPADNNTPPVESGFVTFDSFATPVLSGLVRDEEEALPAVGMAVGDVELDGVRGIVSFNISEVPAGVTLVRAVLRLPQVATNGNPYSGLGSMVVDHINTNGFFDNLNNQLYEGLLISGPIGGNPPAVLSTDETLEVKSLPVTLQVIEDIAAGRSRSQFRVRFEIETNVNPQQDLAIFGVPGGDPALAPRLEITYRE